MSDYMNSLPNELLLAIFDRIPLTNLLRLDRVSLRWATLQPSACNRRRTLVLILGGQRLDEVAFTIPFNDHCRLSFETRPFCDLPSDERASSITLPNLLPQNVTFYDYLLIDDDDNEDGFFDMLYRDTMMDGAEDEDTEMARFRCAYFSHELVAYFANLFPNVHNLVVVHPKCNEYDLRSLIGLVGSWPLVTLKLWTRFYGIDHQYEHRPEQHPVLDLLKAIKLQSSLQHLTLNIDGEGDVLAFPVESYTFTQPLKVLKHNIGNYADNDELWDTVHRLDSDNLGYIGLANYFNTQLARTVLNPQFEIVFTAKVRQLYYRFHFANVEHLSQLCARYCSLTLLRIEWVSDSITFTELVSNLASLRQLTHLSICIDQMPVNPFVLMMDRADDGQEVRRISLPQVKILEMTIVKRSHQEFESLEAFVFPSVESIMLKDGVSQCTVCGLDGRIVLGTGKCHRQLLLSFKNKFAVSLRRLYSTQGFYSEWIDWSNYVPMQDADFPEIGDLADAEDDDDEDVDGDDDNEEEEEVIEDVEEN